MKLKPITFIFRVIVLVLMLGILVYVSKALLFPVAKDVKPPINTEHYVLPIKSGVIKDAMKNLGTVSSTSGGMKVSVPASASDKLGLAQIQLQSNLYGTTISQEVDQVVITLSEGEGATVLVPVPMLIALIDRGLLDINKSE